MNQSSAFVRIVRIVLFLGVVIPLLINAQYHLQTKQYQRIEAVIIDKGVDEDFTHNKSDSYQTSVVVRYELGRVPYQGVLRTYSSSQYEIGEKIHVCYNPQNPATIFQPLRVDTCYGISAFSLFFFVLWLKARTPVTLVMG